MNSKHILKFGVVFFVGFLFHACANSSEQTASNVTLVQPEWSKNSGIYEVNIRQYSPEGTFAAFTQDIPRIKELGIDILWIMPIHPIGEKNRKGGKGSYYSVKDYKAVNPDFGTIEDFKDLVDEAHKHGMKVILDWVANHTAWDHPWTKTNPEWYTKNEAGEFTPPVDDWSDVIDLNFDEPGLRDAMIDALSYWVREHDVDGYRCDVAGMVPSDFWEKAREELDKIKPVFMLAEDEGNKELLNKAFNMNYGWEFHHVLTSLHKGEKSLSDLEKYLEKERSEFPSHAYRMFFTSNHDENSWKGSDTDMFGDNFLNYAVLAGTVHGVPLIYNGQESGLNKQLMFFEKDQIEWGNYAYSNFYKKLLTLKKENPALWNGDFGGDFARISTGFDEEVFAYQRTKENRKVVVFINFSDSPKTITPFGVSVDGMDVVLGSAPSAFASFELAANSHIVFSN